LRKMVKKYAIAEKLEWLEEYENGKPMIALAKQHHCDTRTVKKALGDARRERDARYARSEIMKEALRNHQDILKTDLNNILRTLRSMKPDFGPLSWHQGENSIFTAAGNLEELRYSLEIAKRAGRPSANGITIRDLLRQHLKNDRVLKLLAEADKAYSADMANREALQRKTKYMLERKTGYKMTDANNPTRPFICSYTAGQVVYEMLLDVAIDGRDKDDFINGVTVDSQREAATYHNSILAEAPGNETRCCKGIIDGFEKLLKSEELQKIQESYRYLTRCIASAQQAAEEITLLGYIPGNCSVCQRLGM
jgi:hypothetical protein